MAWDYGALGKGRSPGSRCAGARGLRRARYRVLSGRAVTVIQSEPSHMRVLNRTLPVTVIMRWARLCSEVPRRVVVVEVGDSIVDPCRRRNVITCRLPRGPMTMV